MAIHDRIRLTGLLREKPCDQQGFSYSTPISRHELSFGWPRRDSTSQPEGGGVPPSRWSPGSQNGQLPGASGMSCRLTAPAGMSCTAIVWATAPLSFRMMWTWPSPGSTNALFGVFAV